MQLLLSVRSCREWGMGDVDVVLFLSAAVFLSGPLRLMLSRAKHLHVAKVNTIVASRFNYLWSSLRPTQHLHPSRKIRRWYQFFILILTINVDAWSCKRLAIGVHSIVYWKRKRIGGRFTRKQSNCQHASETCDCQPVPFRGGRSRVLI